MENSLAVLFDQNTNPRKIHDLVKATLEQMIGVNVPGNSYRIDDTYEDVNNSEFYITLEKPPKDGNYRGHNKFNRVAREVFKNNPTISFSLLSRNQENDSATYKLSGPAVDMAISVLQVQAQHFKGNDQAPTIFPP